MLRYKDLTYSSVKSTTPSCWHALRAHDDRTIAYRLRSDVECILNPFWRFFRSYASRLADSRNGQSCRRQVRSA
ncbi:MAG: hypothetical protein EBX78_02060 [Gammaproteobacteria bacterium]|nr:hypothetical protein [Gammaproteobacteria bacterium]